MKRLPRPLFRERIIWTDSNKQNLETMSIETVIFIFKYVLIFKYPLDNLGMFRFWGQYNIRNSYLLGLGAFQKVRYSDYKQEPKIPKALKTWEIHFLLLNTDFKSSYILIFICHFQSETPKNHLCLERAPTFHAKVSKRYQGGGIHVVGNPLDLNYRMNCNSSIYSSGRINIQILQ